MRGAAIGPKILSFGRQTFKLVFSSDSENLKSNFEVKPVIFLSALQQVGFLNYTQNSKCSLSPLFEDLQQSEPFLSARGPGSARSPAAVLQMAIMLETCQLAIFTPGS